MLFQPGASTDSGGGVVNERSVLKLVWFKLRWLGVSDKIDLQIDRRQQWKRNRVTPHAHCIRPSTDLIDFTWGDPEMHCGSVRSDGRMFI